MSLQIARALILLTLSLPLTQAANLTYDLTFGPASDGGASPTGSFTYDTTNNTFVRFDVAFRGFNIDFATFANTASIGGQSCPDTPSPVKRTFAALTGCALNTSWRVSILGNNLLSEVFFRSRASSIVLFSIMANTPNPAGINPFLTGGSASGLPVTATAEVPEPTAALPLLLSLGWLAHRRKRSA